MFCTVLEFRRDAMRTEGRLRAWGSWAAGRWGGGERERERENEQNENVRSREGGAVGGPGVLTTS